MDERISFGALLRRSRIVAGLTQEALARNAGVSLNTISNLERGVSRRPHLDTVQLLANGLALPTAARDALMIAAIGRQPPPAVSHLGPSNLPTTLPPFLGRADDLVRVRTLARPVRATPPGTHDGAPPRLVTLTGTAGIGKTRLALAAAASLLPDYPDGVWLVELAPLDDPTLLAQLIADVIIPRQIGTLSAEDRLFTQLKTQRALLVLDNCEHLLPAMPFVEKLLQHCSEVQVLATSRTRLDLASETLYPVPPLLLPDRPQRHSFAVLKEFDAVALFFARAKIARGGVDLPDETAPVVAEVVWVLAGLPLAIELAAARCAVLHPAAVLTQLQPGVGLLRTRRARHPRHASLRVALDWSYDRLDPEEQTLFRRMAAFPSGATLAAVEHVCVAAGALAVAPLDGLQEIVANSLLRATTDTAGAERYTMLAPVRAYALERLTEHGEVGVTYDALLTYTTAIAQEAAPALLQGTQQAQWAQRLGAERDTLRAALGWAEGHEPERGLILACNIGMYWFVHGASTTEGQSWLTRLLARTSAATVTTARAQYWLAHLHLFEHVAEARQLLDKALISAEALDDDDLVATVLAALLFALFSLGESRTFDARLEQAKVLVARTNHGYLHTALVTFRGYDADRRGALLEARTHLTEALALSEAYALPLIRCIVLIQMTRICLFQGDPDGAGTLAAQLVAVAEGIGAERYVLLGHLQHGVIAEYRGNLPAATDAAMASLGEAQEAEDRVGVVASHVCLTRLACHQEAWALALTRAVEGLALARALDDRMLLSDLLRAQALAEWATGARTAACAAATECHEILQASNHQRRLVEWLEVVARLAAEGSPATARAWLAAAARQRQALAIPLPPVDLVWYAALVGSGSPPQEMGTPPPAFMMALSAASAWLASPEALVGCPTRASDA